MNPSSRESWNIFCVATLVAMMHITLVLFLINKESVSVQTRTQTIIQGTLLTLTPAVPEMSKEQVQPVAIPSQQPGQSRPKQKAPKPAPPKVETTSPTVEKKINQQAVPVKTVADDHQVAPQPVVVPPHIDKARRLRNRPPPYPRLSKRLQEEGEVIIELWILKDGTVSDAVIAETSGYDRLDKAALRAVKKWRYLPATQDGQPIAYHYRQQVQFSLK